jgi:hypothetical protein
MRCLLNNVTSVTGFATKETIMEKAQRPGDLLVAHLREPEVRLA